MQTHFDLIIIGQGIAGTLLSYECYKKGLSFLVVDEYEVFSSSRISGAVLNPQSANKNAAINQAFYTKAIATYSEMETLLGARFLHFCEMAWFDHPHFEQQFSEPVVNDFEDYFSFKKVNKVAPAAYIDSQILLSAWRSFLASKNLLLAQLFSEEDCLMEEDKIVYKNFIADNIVFCNGVQASISPLFSSLPFTKNRGDALLVSIPDLPQGYVFHQQKRLIPRGKNLYWFGSNYTWQFDNLDPDIDFLIDAERILENWLKVPFGIVAHSCAERPTTAGQIPFIGWHPKHRSIGIVNGLGTKGFTAGPLWIADFVECFTTKSPTIFQSTLDKFLG